ncbi:hypothetical protein J4727_05580 [Providencia rettgeri]|uniref:Uncharacterized protein n=1 Tax=Providencia rettgeri TaxID=587 RepID=A0A939SQM1_PRORE|nr:hypothetical protein [Providencia rettgeri]
MHIAPYGSRWLLRLFLIDSFSLMAAIITEIFAHSRLTARNTHFSVPNSANAVLIRRISSNVKNSWRPRACSHRVEQYVQRKLQTSVIEAEDNKISGQN